MKRYPTTRGRSLDDKMREGVVGKMVFGKKIVSNTLFGGSKSSN